MSKIEWLTAAEVAEMLCVRLSQLWENLDKVPGYPQPYKLSGRRTRWIKDEVLAYIESCRRIPAAV